MSNIKVFIQVQSVIIVSAPSVRNKKRGRRLIKKASLTAVLTLVWAQSGDCGFGCSEVITGKRRVAKIIRRVEDIIIGVGCIAATWICTKSLWFLRPTDELLSYRSGGKRGSFGVQPRGQRLAVSVAASLSRWTRGF